MKNPRRPLLIGGLCLLAVGLALYLADALAGARHWLVLAGALLILLYFVLARAAKAPVQRDAESMLYDQGHSTMMDDIQQRKDD
jgi:hypothetical protein